VKKKTPWHLSHNPAMKMKGRAADFCGTREKREENFNAEKGGRLFLPWIFFPLSPSSFLPYF
jgi:hypothetical protein